MKKSLIKVSILAVMLLIATGCTDKSKQPDEPVESAAVEDLDEEDIPSELDLFYDNEEVKPYGDIRELDEDYSSQQAQMDNCFVIGAMVHNDYLYAEFMDKSRNNQNAFIRVVQNTTEGDAIIYDILHIAKADETDEEVLLVADTTRDKFAADDERAVALSHYSGTMEYEEDGHLYWVAYRGEPDEVAVGSKNTFVIAFIN